MGFNTDFVSQTLEDKSFEILNMEQNPDNDIIILTIVHDIHPDDHFTVSLISKDEEGNDVMTMQFDGPDTYTEEEAKQVLQEVMDTLTYIIEKAITDEAENQALNNTSEDI